MELEKIIKEKAGTIVDVRTREEFMGGNVNDSINIPLQEIQQRLGEIKKLKTPLVLCCASGGRSAMATDFLSSQGIECLNGGSWLDVNYYKSKTI
ncbi:MAG TPA: rhodanese-like domain-containing protein [Paludibacter sp.]|nr:rhodanese-like domain-containing protein [Paludibacter sp.]